MKSPLLKISLWLICLLPAVLALARETAGKDEGGKPVAVEFTAVEKAWMEAHPVIRAGHDTSYEPYAIQDSSGQIVGIDPDYLQLFAERTGLKFKNETRRDWLQMLEDFKGGQVDVLLSLGYAPEREQYMVYTNSYAFAPNVIITRNDSPYLFSLSDLKGRTISIPSGYAGLRRDLDASAPGNVVVEYETPVKCYEAVARGEVFASIGDVANASYLIKSHRLTNLRLGSVISATSEIYIGVRKDWPVLAGILNKVLASFSVEDRQRINNRWVAVDYAADWWWAKAFKVAAVIATLAVGVFLLVLFHNRRLAVELAQRRRIQAELEQTRDQLVKASHEKSELLHMVAHDLRSPLTGIQLAVEALHFDPPLAPAELLSAGRHIGGAAAQMTRLINDLLSAQNVEAGHFSLNYAKGDAVQLAQAAATALQAAAHHKRITIAVLAPEAIMLTTDFVALQQVVDNLLSNALKYSPPGSRVELAASATATHFRLEVRDQGPGVKSEEREKIFEKFGRGSAQPTQGEDSVGLGLWIVRRFVVALNGTVRCETGLRGLGSVFVVEVPLQPAVV
jgi:signal transduction histidine kinase